jgi:hypothetical protein
MQPIASPSRSLKFAIAFLARVTTGFWPESAASCAEAASISFWFWIASPSPMFSEILLSRGTCMGLP